MQSRRRIVFGMYRLHLGTRVPCVLRDGLLLCDRVFEHVFTVLDVDSGCAGGQVHTTVGP